MKKKILSAALAAALTVGAAGAVGGDAAAIPAGEGEPAVATQPAYEIGERNAAAQPLVFTGKAVELGEQSFTIQDESQEGSYNKVVVNVSEATPILDALTGQVMTLADVAKDAVVQAYVDPAMTRSIPPIASAVLVLVGVPENGMGVPTYAEVRSVTVREDGGVDALMTGDVILHLNADTEFTGFRTKIRAGLDDVKPGAKLLSWYDFVALSLPAQATPGKVMVFPYQYAGYLSADGVTVSLDGQALAQSGRVVDNRLMFPVRALAEAMGCTVTWEPYTNQVAVKSGEDTRYSFTIGGENVTMEGDMVVGLTLPSFAEEGVTYMAIDDLLSLHNLKLAETAF